MRTFLYAPASGHGGQRLQGAGGRLFSISIRTHQPPFEMEDNYDDYQPETVLPLYDRKCDAGIRSTHNCIYYSLWRISFWLPALRWQSDWASPKLDGLASAGSFLLTAVSLSIVRCCPSIQTGLIHVPASRLAFLLSKSTVGGHLWLKFLLRKDRSELAF